MGAFDVGVTDLADGDKIFVRGDGEGFALEVDPAF